MLYYFSTVSYSSVKIRVRRTLTHRLRSSETSKAPGPAASGRRIAAGNADTRRARGPPPAARRTAVRRVDAPSRHASAHTDGPDTAPVVP